MSQEANRIKKVYNTVYRHDPKDRAYLWNPYNAVSIFYRQAQERALITLFNRYKLELSQMRVLDIGCGDGGFLRFLLSLGVPSNQLFGQDLMAYRIKTAKDLCPAKTDLKACDAAKLPYQSDRFNLISQFTVFSSILDLKMRQRVAQEMQRVLAPRGYILWYDMRQGFSKNTRGLEIGEIKKLFPKMKVVAAQKLHPPHVTLVARKSILLAEIWDYLMIFRKTHYLILLQAT